MKINRTTISDILIFTILIFACMALSAALKFNFGWDFANYHYYNAWAFLNNRLNYDIAPASLNTFFNPLIDLPLYFYIQYFNDKTNLVFALQGAWFGALLFVFYKIYTLFFSLKNSQDIIFLILAFGICISGTATWYQIGSCTNEISVAFFILWGFYILLKMIKFPDTQKWQKFLIAGLIIGIGLGLKQTMITFCIASGLTLIICRKYLQKPLKSIFWFALGGLIGYLIIDGYFMYQRYMLYQNPFFPFMNGVFHSPYFDDFNFRDTRFLPSLKLFLIYPFLWNLRGYSIAEVSFFDLRLTLLYVVLLVLLATFLLSFFAQKSQKNSSLSKSLDTFFFVFILLSFILWMGVFSILRYAVILEVLSTIFFIKIIMFLFDNKNILLTAVGTSALLIVLLLPPFSYNGWGKHKSENHHFLEIEDISLPQNTLLKLYNFPTAFVIPSLVKDTNIRAMGYMHYNCKYMEGSDFVERGRFRAIRENIEKTHKGPVVIIFMDNTLFLSEATSVKDYLEKIEICEQKPDCHITFCPTEDKIKEIIRSFPTDYICQPLKNNIDSRIKICTPPELKNQIFGENND